MSAVISPIKSKVPGDSNMKHKVRFVTAASLFDGHDAAINIMRRILQASGAEVIHLGHNRSVNDIVTAALQEDVQGIAISSYQGGHVEFFKYAIDLLRARGGEDIKVFGGGGGVIIPEEIRELHAYGVTRIFSPEDDRGLRRRPIPLHANQPRWPVKGRATGFGTHHHGLGKR
jgi:methylmalonyl-CoA mutase